MFKIVPALLQHAFSLIEKFPEMSSTVEEVVCAMYVSSPLSFLCHLVGSSGNVMVEVIYSL